MPSNWYISINLYIALNRVCVSIGIVVNINFLFYRSLIGNLCHQYKVQVMRNVFP